MKLEVNDICKSFSGNEVLHNVSFKVYSGKALGLLGRNGAGKTTTIRILMDIFKADSGEILLDGKTFVYKKYKIGYLPEERGLYPKKKVIEQLIYLGKLRGLSSKDAKINLLYWLQKLEISEYKNRVLETLSKGNQQKVQLVQALIANPDIVILDEPFSGLDPVNSQILKNVVKEIIDQGKIVIFSSHQMNYVEEFCDEIVIINKGNIVLEGNLKDIKKDFGENKIILSSNNYSLEQLEEKIIKEFSCFVEIDSVNTNFIVLKLKKSKDKKEFLNAIVKSDIDVEKFGDYEASLNDIFILKAGDN